MTSVWIEWFSAQELAEADRVLLDDEHGCGAGCSVAAMPACGGHRVNLSVDDVEDLL